MIEHFLTNFSYVEEIKGKLLDRHLEFGWFRVSGFMYTCSFIELEHQLYTTIWARLALPTHQFRKGQRKLINKVNKNFRTEIQALHLNTEKETLYRDYVARQKGMRVESLTELSKGVGGYIPEIDTMEISVYDGDELIAMSFFDVGEESVASISAFYADRYRQYSLGYYTMLAEIQWCKDNHIKYYYPGYIIPRNESFDYKKRIGNLEYLDQISRQWYDQSLYTSDKDFAYLSITKLQELQALLPLPTSEAYITYHKEFSHSFASNNSKKFLHYPLFLYIKKLHIDQEMYLVIYNFFYDTYDLLLCLIKNKDYTVPAPYFSSKRSEASLQIIIKEQILTSSDPLVIVLHLHQLLKETN